MLLSDALAGVGVREITGPSDREVDSVGRDSRLADARSVFVAIRGAQVDGHMFAPATSAGVVVVDRPVRFPQGATCVRVDDTRVALAQISSNLWGHPWRDVPVIGVTGTNGKTTVTSLIHQALAVLGHASGRIGTLGRSDQPATGGATLTTPEAPQLLASLAAMRDEGAFAAAIEASSIGIVQRRLDGVRVHTAVFTNLSGDHLDVHGTMAAYAEAKRRLFTHLLRDRGGAPRAVLCGDDPAWERMQPPSDRWLYGFRPDADIRVDMRPTQPDGSCFSLCRKGGKLHQVKLALMGEHNALNAAAAWAALLTLGVDESEAAGALEGVGVVDGRFERVPNDKDRLVVVDYAHSDAALDVALRAVRAGARGRVWVVFGAGGDRDADKRPRMGSTAEQLADRVVITTDNARGEDPGIIAAEILAGMKRPRAAHTELDRGLAIRYAIGRSNAGDAVLIAGKGHETTQTIGGSTEPFDDRDVARRALEEL